MSDTVEEAVDSGEPSTESNAEMEQLMEQYAAPHQAPAEGEIESGQVVAITDLGVVVDLGGKTEGLIPAQEFAELDGPFPLVGRSSRSKFSAPATARTGWFCCPTSVCAVAACGPRLKKPTATKPTSPEKSWTSIKGGLVVDIGVRAFLPASQADLHPVRDLDEWKGREITVRVLKMNRKRGNVVVSRRAILDEQVAAQRQAMLNTWPRDRPCAAW